MIYCSVCGAANPSGATLCFACRQPLSTVKDEDADEQKLLRGRYRLLLPVGTGGFGAVYKALDTWTQERFVAIKQINLKGLSPQQMIDATDTFNREVELLTQLTHPNLPRVYEHFTDPAHWYLIMDFIEGQTLEQMLLQRGGPLSVNEVLEIGLQLCAVLHYLHTRHPPIIFRDVKPANIMLSLRKQVYLIDFGAARLFKPGRPRDTIAFGSPGYAAPEQYGKAQTTPRSDIYSLGATLYHLLTGRDPSDAPFHFVPPRNINPGIAPELSNLLMSMLRLDATQRPHSMEVVKEQLEKLANKRHVHPHMLSASTSTSTPMNSMPSPPPPPAEWAVQAPTLQQAQIQLGLPPTPMPTPITSPSKSKRKSVSRRSVVAGIASVTLVLGLFGGDLLVFGPHRPSTNTGPEILSDQTIGLKQPYTYPAGGKVRSMDWSSSLANQDEVVFATPDVVKVFNGDSGQNSSDFSNSTLLANANAQTAAWSPQSEIIAVGTSDGNIITLTPDQHYTNTGIHRGTIHATRWSPDGTHLASAGEDSVVVVSRYNVNGQLAPVTAYHGHIGPVYALSWTSDGLRVASVGQDGIVHIWDARTGKMLQQYNANADQLYTVAFSPRDDSLLAFAGASGIVYVWNSKSEQIQAAYIGHKGPVRCLAWTFDGLTIASGGGGSFGGGADPDFSIQIWDAMNGGLHRIYSQHTAPVTGVVWTPNTSISRLASCSEDGTIIIWPTTPNS